MHVVRVSESRAKRERRRQSALGGWQCVRELLSRLAVTSGRLMVAGLTRTQIFESLQLKLCHFEQLDRNFHRYALPP